MTVKDYKDLKAWQYSMDLAERTYALTADFPKSELFGLVSQMRRSAVSIPSNIAEGAGRKGNNQYRQFLFYSLGSLAELETQYLLVKRLNYKSEDEHFPDLIIDCRKTIYGLIRGLSINH